MTVDKDRDTVDYTGWSIVSTQGGHDAGVQWANITQGRGRSLVGLRIERLRARFHLGQLGLLGSLANGSDYWFST